MVIIVVNLLYGRIRSFRSRMNEQHILVPKKHVSGEQSSFFFIHFALIWRTSSYLFSCCLDRFRCFQKVGNILLCDKSPCFIPSVLLHSPATPFSLLAHSWHTTETSSCPFPSKFNHWTLFLTFSRSAFLHTVLSCRKNPARWLFIHIPFTHTNTHNQFLLISETNMLDC